MSELDQFEAWLKARQLELEAGGAGAALDLFDAKVADAARCNLNAALHTLSVYRSSVDLPPFSTPKGWACRSAVSRQLPEDSGQSNPETLLPQPHPVHAAADFPEPWMTARDMQRAVLRKVYAKRLDEVMTVLMGSRPGEVRNGWLEEWTRLNQQFPEALAKIDREEVALPVASVPTDGMPELWKAQLAVAERLGLTQMRQSLLSGRYASPSLDEIEAELGSDLLKQIRCVLGFDSTHNGSTA